MEKIGESPRLYLPLLIGAAGATVLPAIFFGILAWGNSFDHALEQFSEIWYWISLLTVGFGIQLGLFTHVKIHVHEKIAGATAEVAASGGISTGSMVACCAHYLTNVLPLLGLSAAAVFLTKYQTSFLLLGVFSNLIGITFMLYFMQKHGLMPRVFQSGSVSACNMKTVRNATVLLSAIVVSLSFFFSSLN
ncbi:hypothetical protein ACFLQ0_01775 [Nitrospinota bacterium]